MLTTVGKLRRHLMRMFSRTRLLGRWLGLDVKVPESHAPGLVMIQIDGLSREQFEAAVRKRRMPFLKKMLQRGYFHKLSFYSGLPSTTPAVQGEVMYGVKCAVPAFQFLHRKSGRVFRMYEGEAAQTIVSEQLEEGEPLLTGGASYCNIYSGGSNEAHCCAETRSLKYVYKQIRAVRLSLTLLLYSFTLLRVAVLAAVELLVAIGDMVHGVIVRRDWQNEVKFVPARVLTAIVLREWVRIVVKLSIAEGAPVIYANLLGYDEQSHRRGPSSAFAHWGLKGIDSVISDIFRSARHSDTRDYEVVVFSDHGQEATRIYEFEFGKTIDHAVADALRDGPLANRMVTNIDAAVGRGGHLDQWMRHLLNIRRGRKPSDSITTEQLIENIIITAMGPLGHIYFPIPITDEAKAECAARLVQHENVPLVIYRLQNGDVYGHNIRGVWNVRSDCAEICGAQQTLLAELQEDILRLSANENSGDLIISGWDPEKQPLTFNVENGSHGSIGLRETRGFALIPNALRAKRRTTSEGENWIRGVDLHDAALDYLRKQPDEGGMPKPMPSRDSLPESSAEQDVAAGRSGEFGLRVMTYNAHHCIGMDGRCRPLRIASVIAESGADVVALQEMDDNRKRSNFQNQSLVIASGLGMYHRFFPVIADSDERYGLAILSRFPFEAVREDLLTRPDHRTRGEARGAMWVVLDTHRGPVHVINTHLGLRNKDRLSQIRQLLGRLWLADIPPDEPVILCGDLNAGPNSEVMRHLELHFQCVQVLAEGHAPQPTFASVFPVRRIDHLLVSQHVLVQSVSVVRNHLTQVASDHLPLMAELTIPRSTDGQTSATVAGTHGNRSLKDSETAVFDHCRPEGAA